MFLAPMETSLGERKIKQFEHSMAVWDRFTRETADKYGVDMRVLNDPYREEQRKYFLQVSGLYRCYFSNFLYSEVQCCDWMLCKC